jgi:ferredoxin
MKVKVDEDLCTGCEDCCNDVPEVFEMNDDGIAVVKVDEVPADKVDAVKRTAEECPAAAIEVEE